MNALRYSLKQLLTAHRDRKFVVPNYQCEYEWETPSEGKGEVGKSGTTSGTLGGKPAANIFLASFWWMNAATTRSW
ncbi:MAG: hypothetical protein JOZ31_01885 [Verrucomicrobia bacterium]|nr:hypothetical protein [Verrucomicrobiota bacterium]MBV8485841.1 hypothetical protein [Verrucomicrobiota bacterium]